MATGPACNKALGASGAAVQRGNCCSSFCEVLGFPLSRSWPTMCKGSFQSTYGWKCNLSLAALGIWNSLGQIYPSFLVIHVVLAEELGPRQHETGTKLVLQWSRRCRETRGIAPPGTHGSFDAEPSATIKQRGDEIKYLAEEFLWKVWPVFLRKGIMWVGSICKALEIFFFLHYSWSQHPQYVLLWVLCPSSMWALLERDVLLTSCSKLASCLLLAWHEYTDLLISL